MKYLVNSFSLQMIDLKKEVQVRIAPITIEVAKDVLQFDSILVKNAIGHEDTAAVIGKMLGVELHSNRINVKATPQDTIIVAQLTGGRLPEGATTLPEGFNIQFAKVEFLTDWEVTYVDVDNSPICKDYFENMTYQEVLKNANCSGCYDMYINC